MKSLLKRLNERTPDFIKRLFAKQIRNKLIRNEVFLEQYKALEESKTLYEPNFNKVKEILLYAYENVPYYKKLYDGVGINVYSINNFESFSKLPMTDKQELLEHEVKSDEPIAYYEGHTGGSTGRAADLYLSMDSIYREKAFIYYYWSQFGYDFKSSKLITLRGIDVRSGKITKYNPLYNEYIMSANKLDAEHVQTYMKLIEKFKPDYLHGYPSALLSFAKYAKLHSFHYPFKGIFLISEAISTREKALIESYYGCKAHSFYGHSERAIFGEEFDGDYKFNNLYGYVELLPYSDTRKKIITTGFINKVMPLIRYNTDDFAIEEDGKLLIDGWHKIKFYLVDREGHQYDLFDIELTGDTFIKVSYYQFVQREPGKATLVLELIDDISDFEKDIIQTDVRRIVPDSIEIDFEYGRVDKTKTGKTKRILQYL